MTIGYEIESLFLREEFSNVDLEYYAMCELLHKGEKFKATEYMRRRTYNNILKMIERHTDYDIIKTGDGFTVKAVIHFAKKKDGDGL